MDIMTMLTKMGLDVRCFMDNTLAGNVIGLLMFIAILTLYFTLDGNKKETR